MKTLQLTDGILTVSPTQLDTYRACSRMWKHRYVDLRTKAGAAPARDGGKAVDAAFNIRYQQMGSAPATPGCETAMIEAANTALAAVDMPFEEWRTPVRYAEAIKLYNEYYGDEPFDVLGVQVPFDVHLGMVPVRAAYFGREIVEVRLHGILDLLTRLRDSGLVLVFDTKTSEKWGNSQQAAYDNHAQMKSYCYAVPQMRKQLGDAAGPPWATMPDVVHGAMVNAVVLRKPYARPDSAAKTNAKPRNEFHRFVVSYTEERLEEWRQDTLRWCRRILEDVADGHFPQNESSCAAHFGRKCDYLDVCKSPIEQREMILSFDQFTDYKRGPLAEVAQPEGEVQP